jgi:hypothetical protein
MRHKYVEEILNKKEEEIYSKMNEILEISEKKNYILMETIERKKKEIEEIGKEIKKYIRGSCTWGYFTLAGSGEVSLIRRLYSRKGLDMIGKKIKIKDNEGEIKSEYIYYLMPKIEKITRMEINNVVIV